VEDQSILEPLVRGDFADPRSDVCELEGAIRIRGSTSEVFVVTPSRGANGTDVDGWRIQPYTRKGEPRVMDGITSLAVRVVAADEAPACTARHDVPAVVYSNGGYCGNYYHDFNDNIIPLFITARHLGGEVQLLVAQKQAWWFRKYREIVDGLTRAEAGHGRVRRAAARYEHAVPAVQHHGGGEHAVGAVPARAPRVPGPGPHPQAEQVARQGHLPRQAGRQDQRPPLQARPAQGNATPQVTNTSWHGNSSFFFAVVDVTAYTHTRYSTSMHDALCTIR
jgi:hypothetical protein